MSEATLQPRDITRSTINANLTSLRPNKKNIELGFRTWQVEPLLVSSAEILERCSNLLRRIESLEESKLIRDIEKIREKYQFEETEKQLGVTEEIPESYLEKQQNLDREHYRILLSQVPLWTEAYNNIYAVYNESTATRKSYGPAMAQHNISKSNFDDELAQAAFRSDMSRMDSAPVNAVKREIVMREAVIKLRNKAAEINNVQNYETRVEQTSEMLKRDYQDALDRLGAAAEGLKSIFGYNLNFDTELEQAHKNFNDAVTCATVLTRNALKWLSEFSGMDQAFTVSVSLNQLLSEDAFKEFLSGNSVSIPLKEDIFKDYCYIRLRGISACYQAKKEDAIGTIRLRLVAPKLAKVLFSDRDETIKQDKVPHCDVGRVAPFGFPQPMEIAGNVAMMNVSPIGASNTNLWQIELCKDSIVESSSLQDVLLDFRCNGRPKISPSCPPLAFFKINPRE